MRVVIRVEPSGCLRTSQGRVPDHLAVFQMRRDGFSQSRLRRAGQGRQDQVGPFHRFRDIGGGERQRHLPPAPAVGNKDNATVENRFERFCITPPEPDIMARFGRIRRRRVTSMPAAQYRYFHDPCSRCA